MSIDVETLTKKLKEKFMVDVSEEEIHDLISSSVKIIRGGQPVSIREIKCSRASVVSGLSVNSHDSAAVSLQKPCDEAAAVAIQKEADEKEADEGILHGIKDVLLKERFVLDLDGKNSDLDEATKNLDLQENNCEKFNLISDSLSAGHSLASSVSVNALKTLAIASSNKAPIPISDSLTAGSSLAASLVSVSD